MNLADKLAAAASVSQKKRTTWVDRLEPLYQETLFDLRRRHKKAPLNLVKLREDFIKESKSSFCVSSWRGFFLDDGSLYPEPKVNRGKKR